MQGVLIAAAAVTTVIVAINTLTSWTPVRWLFRRLIAGPLSEAWHRELDQQLTPLRAEMSRIRAELTANGGSSLKDVATNTARRLDAVGDEVADLAAGQIHLDRNVQRLEEVLRASLSASVKKEDP